MIGADLSWIASTVMIDIRSVTVLPADREPVTLTTSDGLRLVVSCDPEGSSPAATLVCLHPLPTAGGMMDSQSSARRPGACRRWPGSLCCASTREGRPVGPVRATGRSTPVEREGLDLLAALDLVAARAMPNVWLFGWSFGSDVTLQHGLDPRVVGAVLLSPPLRSTSDAVLDRWAADGRPLVALVPELDDYLRPAEARQRFARVHSGRGHRRRGRTSPLGRRAVRPPGARRAGPGRRWAGGRTPSDHLGRSVQTHQDLAPLA